MQGFRELTPLEAYNRVPIRANHQATGAEEKFKLTDLLMAVPVPIADSAEFDVQCVEGRVRDARACMYISCV